MTPWHSDKSGTASPGRRLSTLRLRTLTLVVAIGAVAVTLNGVSPREAAVGGVPVNRENASRPNILLITTDDQSLHDLRYMPITRRLLADQGVTFTGISPHPLCCPARAEILTGQFAQNNGVRSNVGRYGGYAALAQTTSSVGTWLDDAGYRTAFMGKFLNGYGYHRDGKTDSPLPGWDNWDGTVRGVYDYRDFTTSHDGRIQTHRHTYQTDFFTDLAVKRIQTYADRSTPFFLWQSYVAPHGSCLPSHENDCWSPPVPARRHAKTFRHLALWDAQRPDFNERNMSDKPSWMREWRVFAGNRRARLDAFNRGRVQALQAVDQGVGRMVSALRATGELSNTLILFTSDNGYLLGEHRYAGKVLAYEPSLRVPLLVRGPGFPAGTTVPDVATTVDLAPTIAAAAGATPDITVDGHDLRPVATGERPSWTTLLVQAGARSAKSPVGWFFRGVRTDRYTYVAYRGPGRARELYDRIVDPYELRNVVEDTRYAGVRDELGRRLRVLSSCAGSTSCDRDFGPDPQPAALR